MDKRFVCFWDENYSEVQVENHGIEFFKVDVGYAQEDIDVINKLDRFQCHPMDSGHHCVLRVN